jgi:hypothetical protein
MSPARSKVTASARSAAIAVALGASLFAWAACRTGSRSTASAVDDAGAGAGAGEGEGSGSGAGEGAHLEVMSGVTRAGIGVPCGPLECRQYDSPREAFLDALAMAGAPLVLGVGEAHAPKGATVPSAARRFTDDLLPALAGRASDLLVELMMPPGGCVDAVAEVRRDQEPVTSRHAETDADEYVAMGARARAVSIIPDMLRPTCADMGAIQHAGPDVIDVSLTTIARLSGAQAAGLADRDARSGLDRGKIVVLYGGALHNDLSPPPEFARWSYAPELDAHVQGRFAAIDLVVPEFIGLDETWARLPWWPYYEQNYKSGRLGRKATLFRTGPRSFTLIFATSRDAGPSP